MNQETKIESMLNRCKSVRSLKLERSRQKLEKEVKQLEVEVKQNEVSIIDAKIKQCDFEIERKRQFVKKITKTGSLTDLETMIFARCCEQRYSDGSRFNPEYLQFGFPSLASFKDTIFYKPHNSERWQTRGARWNISDLTYWMPSVIPKDDPLIKKLCDLPEELESIGEANIKINRGWFVFGGMDFPPDNRGFEIYRSIRRLEKDLDKCLNIELVKRIFFRKITEQEYFSLLEGQEHPLRDLEKKIRILSEKLMPIEQKELEDETKNDARLPRYRKRINSEVEDGELLLAYILSTSEDYVWKNGTRKSKKIAQTVNHLFHNDTGIRSGEKISSWLTTQYYKKRLEKSKERYFHNER